MIDLVPLKNKSRSHFHPRFRGVSAVRSQTRGPGNSDVTPKQLTPCPRTRKVGSRFFEPRLGRWISRDPVEEAGDLGLYVFCANSTLDRADFLGFEHCLSLHWTCAFGIPSVKHLCLEARKGSDKITRFELAPPTWQGGQGLKGTGPLGPYMYLMKALELHKSGKFKSQELDKIAAEVKNKLNITLPDALSSVNESIQTLFGLDLAKAYGIFIADTPCSPFVMGVGSVQLGAYPDSTVKTLKKEASHLADLAANYKFTVKKVLWVFPYKIKVGLGYDPLTRNSNSFIGTIMRKAGVEAPAAAQNGAIGYDVTFDNMTWWDQMLQTKFVEGAKQ